MSTRSEFDYSRFLSGPTAGHWTRIGARRRAGVAVPLFSLYSSRSIGIGELPDLRLLSEWCAECGFSILQLLPLNDVGFNFTPYDAQSTFALEPMYLSLEELKGVDLTPLRERLADLRRRFPTGRERVDYGIKRAKLDLLWEIYLSRPAGPEPEFAAFQAENDFWLPDYTLFKVLKDLHAQARWEDWPRAHAERAQAELAALRVAHSEALAFQAWLQWQLAEQFRSVRSAAESRGVLLMGDLPFLVSRDSADVWAHQDLFRLDLASGAPPDAYSALGQRWGMPPYRWEVISANGYEYLVRKLRYAERFFDFYRIDHFVGIFRLWTIPLSEPEGTAGLNGTFEPADEGQWESHGRRLLEVMLGATRMLPCAEDLGVIPACSYRVLEAYNVVGMDIQRWMRDWEGNGKYLPAEAYRPHAIAVLSTHDMTPLRDWWEHEAGTIDEALFRRRCPSRGLDADALIARLFDPSRSGGGRLYWRRDVSSEAVLLSVLQRRPEELKDFLGWYRTTYAEQAEFWEYVGMPGPWSERFTPELAERALQAANRSRAVFSIHLLQDWLGGTEWFRHGDPRRWRINLPGTTDPSNWSVVMPFPLEALPGRAENRRLLEMNRSTGRTTS